MQVFRSVSNDDYQIRIRHQSQEDQTPMSHQACCLNKEIEIIPGICGKLRFVEVRRMGRLYFLMLEYRFFRESEGGGALPLSLPQILSPVSLMLHTVKSRAYALLRLPCYFIMLETRIVGLFATQESRESLFVASLGVAKEYRRLGIGTCVLGCIEAVARRLGKRWLVVDVLMENAPAQRLYSKYGFAFAQSGRKHNVMRGKKLLQVVE